MTEKFIYEEIRLVIAVEKAFREGKRKQIEKKIPLVWRIGAYRAIFFPM